MNAQRILRGLPVRSRDGNTNRTLSWATRVALALFMTLQAGLASADHLAREDPPEPIFSQRPYIENDLETSLDWTRGFDAQDFEVNFATTWIFL